MRGVFFPQAGSNVAHHQKIRKGDVAAALRASDVRIEVSFDNPPVQHVPMETHAAIAQALPGGRVEVWTSSQSPYTVRHLLALAFDLPHAAVRVHVPYVGGGFGGKAGLGLEPLAYALSKACGGRPVQVSMTREEEFNTTPSRQGLYSTIRLGASRDGRLTALEATYVWDAGAYADYGVNVGRAAAYSGAGPYALDHCSIDSYVVYTNKVYGTAYRGFGHLEVLWGVERAMDRMARELGLDPVEFRRRNLLKEGDTTITGEAFTAGHGKPIECLEAAAKAIDWGRPSAAPSDAGKVRGKGIAMLHKAPAMPTYTSCAAILKLDEDGAADVLVSGVDYGQGTYTVLRQVAAEELGLPIEKVHVTWECDTAMTPYDWQTVASRFSYMGGNAVIEAAADCLAQLRAVASQVLGVPPEELVCRDEKVYPLNEPGRAIAYKSLALGYTFPNGNSIGGPIIGHGRFIATGLTNLDPETGQGTPAQFWTYGAHGVEIEVDTETGEIEVLRIATALDAGKVLNPLLCHGQVVGGIVQGLGSALLEGFQFDAKGRLLNPSFVDYKIPDGEGPAARDRAHPARESAARRTVRCARRGRAPDDLRAVGHRERPLRRARDRVHVAASLAGARAREDPSHGATAMKRLLVERGRYFDSVFLLRISRALEELPGVRHAVVAMGTPANLENLVRVGFDVSSQGSGSDAALPQAGPRPAARPDDLVIAVEADDEAALGEARAEAGSPPRGGERSRAKRPRNCRRRWEMRSPSTRQRTSPSSPFPAPTPPPKLAARCGEAST